MKIMKQACIAGIALLVAGAAIAHHSFAMFDQQTVWTWEGTVVEFQWRQPHAHIIVDVPKKAGGPDLSGRWDFESSSPNIGMRQGWNKASFKPGDKIIVVGHPMRDGSKGGSLKYALGAEGKPLYHDLNREVTPENTPKTNAPMKNPK